MFSHEHRDERVPVSWWATMSFSFSLALFYGGLVRTKNMLSVLMQVLMIASVAMIIWVTYGYSMAFTAGGGLNSYVGGFSKLFLAGVDTTTVVETFSKGVVIPELAFVIFQMTFAAITPGLIEPGDPNQQSAEEQHVPHGKRTPGEIHEVIQDLLKASNARNRLAGNTSGAHPPL